MKDRSPQQQALIDLMSKLESRDGQDTDHALLSDGTNAVGRYGIKPTTAQEMLIRSPSTEYSNPSDKFDMQKQLEDNPDMQEQVMTKLAQHLLNRNQGQLTPAAVGHYKGHNASLSTNQDKLKNMGLYENRIEEAKQQLGIMPTLLNSMKAR